MHAVARLVLAPAITNIQASWVKMGPAAAAQLLAAGANDMGGSIMNESITRAAGACAGRARPLAAAVLWRPRAPLTHARTRACACMWTPLDHDRCCVRAGAAATPHGGHHHRCGTAAAAAHDALRRAAAEPD
jgi:hypothetical protein